MTLTVANILTVSRIFLAPVFMVCMLMDTPSSIAVAVAVFAVAALTDWLDGASARAWDQVTEQGTYLDPLADKILTTTAFATFYLQGIMPLWMVLLMVARDFAITSLRSIAEGKGVQLVTSWHAKVKTFLQMFVIFYILLLVLLAQPSLAGTVAVPNSISAFCADAVQSWYTLGPLLMLTILTVWTAVEYLVRYRVLYIVSRPASEWIVSLGGVGRLPIASGTWGSAVVAVFGILPFNNNLVATITFGVVAGAAIVLGLRAIPQVQKDHGSDPSLVVIDEAAGMALVLMAPLSRADLWWLAAAFLLFRLFDIMKPWPANVINRRHEPWAVIGDDLVAAAYTVGALYLFHAALQPLLMAVALW